MVNVTAQLYPYSDESAGLIHEFLQNNQHVTSKRYVVRQELSIKGTEHDFIDMLVSEFGEMGQLICDNGQFLISFPQTDVILLFPQDRKSAREDTLRETTVTAYVDNSNVHVVTQRFDKHKTQPAKFVNWYFHTSKGELQSIAMPLKHRDDVHDEFYPQFPNGIHKFFDDYLKSEASVLILLGEPGTGKTTLIRDFIHHSNCRSSMTHDQSVMSQDEFFISFMSSNSRTLVVEDADILLYRREDGNTIMSKLLNSGDGLIRTDKKIILSANITHTEQIDPALIRPGRCFGVIEFGALSATEANAAAAKVGLPPPNCTITLAELFGGKARHTKRRTGF